MKTLADEIFFKIFKSYVIIFWRCLIIFIPFIINEIGKYFLWNFNLGTIDKLCSKFKQGQVILLTQEYPFQFICIA